MPGRATYDFSHEQFRKIRAQLLWRIEQLGWDYGKFNVIDERISRSNKEYDRFRFNLKNEKNFAIKTYGMKYTDISFLEMYKIPKRGASRQK